METPITLITAQNQNDSTVLAQAILLLSECLDQETKRRLSFANLIQRNKEPIMGFASVLVGEDEYVRNALARYVSRMEMTECPIFHILFVAHLNDVDMDSLIKSPQQMRLIFIGDRNDKLTPAVFRQSLFRSVMHLNGSERFREQVSNALNFMDIRDGLRSRLLHSAEKDDHSKAYEFIQQVQSTRRKTIVQKPEGFMPVVSPVAMASMLSQSSVSP